MSEATQAWTCPTCGLVNEPTAAECDCKRPRSPKPPPKGMLGGALVLLSPGLLASLTLFYPPSGQEELSLIRQYSYGLFFYWWLTVPLALGGVVMAILWFVWRDRAKASET